MKRLFPNSILIAMGLLVSLLAASCEKENNTVPEETSEPTGLQSITINAPVADASRIVHEEAENGVRVKWTKGDVVRLVPKTATDAQQENIYEYVYNGEAETESARFDLSATEKGRGLPEGDFYAFFGNELEIRYDSELQYVLKTRQGVQGNGFGLDAWRAFEGMKAEGHCDGTLVEPLTMSSLMSMITLVVTPPEGTGIYKVELSAADGNNAFNTHIVYRASDDAPVSASQEVSALTYDATNTIGTQTVCFLLPPQDLTGKQFRVIVNDAYVSEPVDGIKLGSGINYVHATEQLTAFGTTGTEEDPWILRTLEDVCAFTEMSAAELSGKYVELGADIDMQSYDRPAAGGEELIYDLHFDGKGHKISNMGINMNPGETMGLIGMMNGGWVRNLTMENIFVLRGNYAGCVVGQIIEKGELSDITLVDCTVSGDNSTYLGGVAGLCMSNTNEISLKNLAMTGEGKITRTTNLSYITTGTSGGIIGSLYGVNLSGGFNSSAVIYSEKAGGIVGSASNLRIAEGTVLTNTGVICGRKCAGGIFGELAELFEKPGTTVLNNSGAVTAEYGSGDIIAGGYVGSFLGSIYSLDFRAGTNTGRVAAIGGGDDCCAWAGWLYGCYQDDAVLTQKYNEGYQEDKPEVFVSPNQNVSAFKNGYGMNTITTGGYTNTEW